jgi:transcriptional regulator GlxA family with amidase domain
MRKDLAALLLVLGAALPAHPAALRARTGYTRNVAIVLYEGVELLDFAGPGEVFQAAASIGAVDGAKAFRVYTVGASKEPLTSQGFVKILPEFTFADAPPPDVFVIPGGNSRRLLDDAAAMAWVRKTTPEAEVAMTVCTGAFVLAKTGVMAGKDVTTHFGSLAGLQKAVPEARVQSGRRFVDNGSFLTTAGVSAGIDGALHLVARLLGRVVADQTARYMEYAWSPEATAAGTYATLNPSTDARGRARQLANETYNLACLLARAGRAAEALDALESAVKDGFGPRDVLERDEDLAPLRGDPRFGSILATIDAKKPAPKS